MVHQHRRLVFFVASVFALAGCAGKTDAPDQKKTTDASEYEYVTPLGSNIPVRVKKGTAPAEGVSPTGTMTGEQLSNSVHSAGGAQLDKGK